MGSVNPNVWNFPISGSLVPVTVCSRPVVNEAEAVLDAFEPPALPVNIVYLGGGLVPLKIRPFIDSAAPRLKARLAADLASQSR
jgi:hypothetical protein